MRYTFFANGLYLIDNSSQENNEVFFKGNQQTTAAEIHFSKQTINRIMHSLANNSFITPSRKEAKLISH